MIISCPACESRFKVPAGHIPAGGRRVRCGKCGHSWPVAADGTPKSGVGASPPAAAPGEPGGPTPVAGDPKPVADKMPDRVEDSQPPVSGTDDGPGPQAEPPGPGSGSAADSARTSGSGAEPSGEAELADPAETGGGPGDTVEPARPAIPPGLRAGVSPAARQKLAEARKGRSRVRFLVVLLLLMIAAAVAVSFIKGPVGVNDALRTVPDPGPDSGGAGGTDIDEDAGNGAQ